VQSTPIPKVFVVVAANDLAENVAVSAVDVVQKQLPVEFAPPNAIAAPEIAVGKYTTSRIYKGEILIAPLLSDSKQTSQLAARIPEGKVAMAVAVDDAMNVLGALHAGDHVDVLLSLDLKNLLPLVTPQAGQASSSPAGQTAAAQTPPELSTQLTMQNVEILAVGPPAGDVPAANTSGQSTSQPAQPSQQQSRTITFLLDRQDAVTLKYIKDSGGTLDLVVRAPADQTLAKTDAVTLDTVYNKFSFRFVQPVTH
ncbi:MAG TPA: Flp pilus assembly protein CpaB, partial [Chloroflexota bacterium]